MKDFFEVVVELLVFDVSDSKIMYWVVIFEFRGFKILGKIDIDKFKKFKKKKKEKEKFKVRID